MRPLDFWPFSRQRPSASGRKLTVLIADDDPYVRADLEQFVSRRGCHAFFASDGTMALRCLTLSRDVSSEFGRIDVVIADADLPGRSGIDLLMAARGNRWDVDIVMTGAFIPPALRGELVRLGAAAVISKPVCLPELERALARTLEEKRTGR